MLNELVSRLFLVFTFIRNIVLFFSSIFGELKLHLFYIRNKLLAFIENSMSLHTAQNSSFAFPMFRHHVHISLYSNEMKTIEFVSFDFNFNLKAFSSGNFSIKRN